MKQESRILILLSASLTIGQALIPSAAAQDCFIQCMERSGCWSGRSSDPSAHCNNQPELCRIQCQGKTGKGWGAIAYSRRDKISGWSFEQSDKATAENLALRFCVRQGGSKCQIEASFNSACGSVAADGDTVTWGTSSTRSDAQQRALAECARAGGRNCAIQAWVCSAPNSGTPPPAPPPAPKSISWGAIAYSSQDMGAGWSQGKNDRAAAESEAMKICSQRGRSCVLETSFNKQCGALAADRNFTGFGTSADQREAQQKAMDACRKAGGNRCALHIAFCSL